MRKYSFLVVVAALLIACGEHDRADDDWADGFVVPARGHRAGPQQPQAVRRKASKARAATAATPLAPAERITLRVSKPLKQLVGDAIERAFDADSPRYDLVLLRSSDPAALEETASGRADLAIVAVKDARSGWREGLFGRTLGYHLPVLAVRSSHPVRSLTGEQMTALVSGRVPCWSALAAEPRRPRVLLQPASALAVWTEGLVSMDPGGRRERSRSRAELLTITAADPGAVALVPLLALRSCNGLRAIALRGVTPSARAFESGSYPLGRRVSLVHRRTPGRRAAAVLRFLDTQEARAGLSQRLTILKMP